jgi:hypothetical protein
MKHHALHVAIDQKVIGIWRHDADEPVATVTDYPTAALFAAAPDMYSILGDLEARFDEVIYAEREKHFHSPDDDHLYQVSITESEWRRIVRALNRVEAK